MLALLPPMSGNDGGQYLGEHTQIGLLACFLVPFICSGGTVGGLLPLYSR